ncbi:MAG TPA: MBOAT family O-acyltransferase [Saprospiraceae bacterium]|nr:MBOAT family O-acyltransferase [Saprospiraceae bacterium]
MVFSSIVFLLYFLPLFLLCYYLVGRPYKNLIILIFSFVFYSWGAPKFIFVILGTTLLDFYLVHWMDASKTRWRRRLLLTLSLSVNLGLLFYFKYSNFFIENVNAMLGMAGMQSVTWTKLVLPIGISFYTFETITYVVDVYRKVHKPLPHFWDYQTYIILFPKLIAGPIIRYHELADQIQDRSAAETHENRLGGFYRFVIGLSKKVIIANPLGAYADQVFGSDFATMDGGTAWAGILCYTFQIYFDFSGYSDMAIGIGKMIGFRFPENFDNPYVSGSITEFWRRWHITLGNWMRNYLYIPLGGNQVSTSRLYFNLWVVFLASGLWHGASWSFIVWGAYHGLFLVLERGFLLSIYKKIGPWFSIPVVFLLVMIGWVFFRVEHLDDAFRYLTTLFTWPEGTHIRFGADFYVYCLLAFFFAFFTLSKQGQMIQNKIFFETYSNGMHGIAALSSLLMFAVCVSKISASGFNPFIYFRF